MKLIALEREISGVDTAQFAPLLKPEARRVWQLTLSGILRETWFRADRNEAVLVLECPSVDEARAALATLPLVEAGLIDFEIIPLVPYPGFERLFEKENYHEPESKRNQ